MLIQKCIVLIILPNFIPFHFYVLKPETTCWVIALSTKTKGLVNKSICNYLQYVSFSRFKLILFSISLSVNKTCHSVDSSTFSFLSHSALSVNKEKVYKEKQDPSFYHQLQTNGLIVSAKSIQNLNKDFKQRQ